MTKQLSGGPRQIVSPNGPVPEGKDYPDLTEEEISELFDDIEPRRSFIAVVPNKVNKRTEGGILKSDAQIEEEKHQITRNGALVIAVGPEVEDVEVGERVIPASFWQPVYIEGREGYVLHLLDADHIAAFKYDD